MIRPATALAMPERVISFFFPKAETSFPANGINKTSGIYEAMVATVVFFASLKKY